MPSWDRNSNPQEAVPCLTGESVGTRSPTWIINCYMRHGQLSICFPSLHQVPIDGWAASPVYTRYPLMLQLGGLLPRLTPDHHAGPHFNSWVDWSSVSKKHTHTHTHLCTYTCTFTHTCTLNRNATTFIAFIQDIFSTDVWCPLLLISVRHNSTYWISSGFSLDIYPVLFCIFVIIHHSCFLPKETGKATKKC